MKAIRIWFGRMALVFLMFFAGTSKGLAQRTTQVNEEFWWGLITSTRVSEKWSWWNDFHFVNETFFIYRTGATYHSPNNQFVTTGGYAILKLRTGFSDGSLIRTEHRPWFQTIYRVPSTKKFSTSFRFRYDARLIANVSDTAIEQGYAFNSRWRFNNAMRYAWGNSLSKHFNFTTSLLNESLITTGPGPNGVPFEHRSHLMLSFNKKNITLNTGYLVRFISVNPSLLRVNHGPFVWLTVNLNSNWLGRVFNQENPGDHSE